MGINNGLRACDLVRTKVGDVRYLKVGETLKIKESKTGKDNILVINKTVFKALQAYLNDVRPGDEESCLPAERAVISKARLSANWLRNGPALLT